MDRQLPRSNGIYKTRDLISSKAYWKLTGTSIRVFEIFLLKRKMKKTTIGKHELNNIVNNGQITFTYLEAEEKYGISKSTFMRARDQLIEVGFIEITEHGGEHQPTRYAISNNWMKYPEESFKRPKSGNLVGQNTRWKKDTVKPDTIKKDITLKSEPIPEINGVKSDASAIDIDIKDGCQK